MYSGIPEELLTWIMNPGFSALVQGLEDFPLTISYLVAVNAEMQKSRTWTFITAALFGPVDTRADDPALLIYTSGTTGQPKGAFHAHRVLLGMINVGSQNL